jgi:hypothetical protein
MHLSYSTPKAPSSPSPIEKDNENSVRFDGLI